MKKYIVALILAGLFSIPAYSAKYEVALTGTQLTQQPDGIWCQEGVSPCKVGLKVLGIYGGGIWEFDNLDRFHLGVWFMGHPTSSGLAVPDENYNSTLHQCNGKCWLSSHFEGQGNIWGIRALYEHKMNLVSVPFSVYGGIYAYTETWTETIDDWTCGEAANHPGGPSWCGPTWRQAKHNWRVPFAGLVTGIGYKNVSLLVTYPVRASGENNKPNVSDGSTEQIPAINKGKALTIQWSYEF